MVIPEAGAWTLRLQGKAQRRGVGQVQNYIHGPYQEKCSASMNLMSKDLVDDGR